MDSEQKGQHHSTWVLRAAVPAAVAAGLCAVIAIAWDFYYDLNDDTMMAAILSGAYTGTPALRNIQSYFPLTVVLGTLQRLIADVPWYGLFLTAMPFVCLYLVLRRIVKITTGVCTCPVRSGAGSGTHAGKGEYGSDGRPAKTMTRGRNARSAVYSTVAVLLFTGLMLYHLVFVQYSVVVGIMGATAAFLFLTMEPQERVRDWTREILPQLLLIWLGFLLRSEMMLFVSPFIALAFLIRLLDMELPQGPRSGNARERDSGTGMNTEADGAKGTVPVSPRNRGKSGEGDQRGGGPLTRLSAALLTIVLVLAGLAAGYLGNYAGYASQAWQEFYEFFDARTELYDFQKLPEYEGNEAFYESIGLDEAEAALIINYNFGLDDDIDAQVLAQIAEYAAQKAAAEETTAQRLKNAIWDYQHAFSSGTEQPYNTLSLVLYILALAAVLQKGINEVLLLRRVRRRDAGAAAAAGGPAEAGTGEPKRERAGRPAAHMILRIAELAVLFAGRSILLLYLYYNNRPVVRLTHSIYLAEAMILVWMILESLPAGEDRAAGGDSRREAEDTGRIAERGGGSRRARVRMGRSSDTVIRIAMTGLVVVVFSMATVMQVRDVQEEYASREEVNEDWIAFMEYCTSNPENVYFTDVYSTVSFSEKIFDGQEEAVNHDLMGGWASKSPLESEKLAYLEVSGSMQEALLEEDCYLASRSSYDVSWIVEYYACKGIAVSVSAEDTIGEFWTIYAVTAVE